MAGRRQIRSDLTAAAIELFATQGYEETTVDEIAETAGVARRTFFRYFRTKEDAVFPDHEACLAKVEQLLTEAEPSEPAMAVVNRCAHVVLAMFAEEPATAVKRYELTRRVESLREREITATNRYQRIFTEYLHRRSGIAEAGDRSSSADARALRDEVAAGAVVAAHNHVLRQWIREGGAGDVHARLDTALATIGTALAPWLNGQAIPHQPPGSDDVLLMVVRKGTPMWRVVQKVESEYRSTS